MDSKIKILHVLGSLKRGGAETWFVQLLEHMDLSKFQIDLLVNNPIGEYRDIVQKRKVNILSAGKPRSFVKHTMELSNILSRYGPYSAIHSHLQLYNGWLLRIAKKNKVPGRIAHLRNTKDGKSTNCLRRTYRAIMRYFISEYATNILAVSYEAAKCSTGIKLFESKNGEIMTGIDFDPYRKKLKKEKLRDELEISEDTYLIGHVGSFRKQKNHTFLLKVFIEVLNLNQNSVLLLVGTGKLKNEIEKNVNSMKLNDKVFFLGDRNNIPEIMKAMDIFVFPSLYEGLPRVLIEAQSAGVHCIASNAITKEAVAIQNNTVTFLDIKDSPKKWALAIKKKLHKTTGSQSGDKAIKHFEARGFDIRHNAKKLSTLYESFAKKNTKL